MAERLYKFIKDPTAVEFLLKGSLKFTPISELNDPAELIPALDREAVRASLERLRRAGYRSEDLFDLQRQERIFQALAPEHQVIPAPRTIEEANARIRDSFYDWSEELERRLDETARTISSRVGVLCLSRRYDSLPMWAHYADNATGLVVEFEGLAQTFSGDATGVLGEPKSVHYRQDGPSVTFEPGSHESLFFGKFEDWSYEREVRVVLPLSSCRRVNIGARVMYVRETAPSRVARIIIGWRASAATERLVREANAHQPKPAILVRAHLHRGQVGVEVPAVP